MAAFFKGRKNIEKKTIKEFLVCLEYFVLFCFGGWVYESVWCSMIEQNKGFINRGFFHGPWIPIYGFGMAVILYTIKRFQLKEWYSIFVISCLLSCICELIGSYVMEFFTGSFLWDYSGEFLNFEGRIALRPELYFGFLSLISVYFILPLYDRFRKKYDWVDAVSFVFVMLFFIDVTYSLIELSLGIR